jgi:hypothetical protein
MALVKSGLKGQFYGHLLTEYIDGNMWRLVQRDGVRFGLIVEGVGTIEPPDGFCFDFASIPAPVRWVYPKTGTGEKDGRYGRDAVIHDWLYSNPGPMGRKLCDQIFLLGMELDGVRPTLRGLFYAAVRVGGASVFGRPDKLNQMRAK